MRARGGQGRESDVCCECGCGCGCKAGAESRGGLKRESREVKADWFAPFVTGEEWKGNEQKQHCRGLDTEIRMPLGLKTRS